MLQYFICPEDATFLYKEESNLHIATTVSKAFVQNSETGSRRQISVAYVLI